MSFLYPNEGKIKTSVEFKELENDNIQLVFTCNGGKHGTDELLDLYVMSAEQLLDILQKYENLEAND